MKERDIENISAVINYIEAHLDSRLDLDTIARAASYSRYHLHRMFTSAAGITPHDYVLRRQLTRAAQLLLFSETPVLDIALICGYESREAFTSSFRDMYKMPPARFRKEGEYYPLLMRFSLQTSLSDRPFTAEDIRIAGPSDIPAWMELVRMAVDGFPHLMMEDYRRDLEKRILKKEALILKDGENAVGAAVFSIHRGHPDPGRIPRKCLIISADLATAMITLAMIVLMPFLPDNPALLGGLLIMSVLRSLCAGIQTPAVNAAIPQLVPPDFLLRFNGINAGLQSLVQFAAPAAAGAVLSLGTLKATLLIDIFTAIPGILLLSAVPLSEGSGSSCPSENPGFSRLCHRNRRSRQNFSSALKAGGAYAFSHRPVRRLLLLYGLFVFLCVPAGFLSGLLVSRVYSGTYGYLTAAELAGFAGMTAGGALMGTRGGFSDRKKTLAAGLVLFGAMPPKTRKAAVSIHESAAFPVFYQSFTIFGSCPIAGMIFSTRSFVRIFRLDVLIQGWHPKYSSFSTSSSIRS